MTENADTFVDPNPSLKDLQVLIDDLSSANTAAGTRDRIKLAILYDKKVEMVDFLQTLGLYVNVVANGSRIIAMKSGFDVRKISEPRILVETGAPNLFRGAVGTIKGSCSSQVAALSYDWFITDDNTKPLKEWRIGTGKGTKVVFEDCMPGVQYYACVVLNGSKGQKVTSPVAMAVA